jgi:hypothetical protein
VVEIWVLEETEGVENDLATTVLNLPFPKKELSLGLWLAIAVPCIDRSHLVSERLVVEI